MDMILYAAVCSESRELARDIGLGFFADEVSDADARELLRMLRNVRLFLKPEATDERPTPRVDNPSFG
jgi:hypothetical protein